MASDLLYHPENETPLRAWLVEKERIIDFTSYRITDHRAHNLILHSDKGSQGIQDRKVLEIPEHKMIISSATERTLRVYKGYYYKVDTILLHPTGIKGKRVCPSCFCSDCDGAGYVKAMIYQWDVVIGDLLKTGSAGIIAWNEHNARWVVRHWVEGWTETRKGCLRQRYDVKNRPTIIILGTLFDFPNLIKPENVSDKEWGHIVSEHRELMEGLR